MNLKQCHDIYSRLNYLLCSETCMQNVVRLPASGAQVQPYSSSQPTSSGGAVSQTYTYRTGSPAGSQSSKTPQPPWSSRMPPRCLSICDHLIVLNVFKCFDAVC